MSVSVCVSVRAGCTLCTSAENRSECSAKLFIRLCGLDRERERAYTCMVIYFGCECVRLFWVVWVELSNWVSLATAKHIRTKHRSGCGLAAHKHRPRGATSGRACAPALRTMPARPAPCTAAFGTAARVRACVRSYGWMIIVSTA